MPSLSDTLSRKLTQIFCSHALNSDFSANQYTAMTTGFYAGKDVPFIRNRDLEDRLGGGIGYSTVPLAALQLTTEEQAELAGAFTTNDHGEIRIVTHNQRKTHRRHSKLYFDTTGKGKYPKGHSPTAPLSLTPYDLSDPGTILGYRGTDLYAFNNSGPTGIISYDSTKTLAPYYLNNGFNGQTGHHPKASTHAHPQLGSTYSAWGGPAIVNRGHTSFGSDQPDVDNYIIQNPTAGTRPQYIYNMSPTCSQIDLQYQCITGSYINADLSCMMAACFNPYMGSGSGPFHEQFQIYGTGMYKITGITLAQLTSGLSGVLQYPIIMKAAKALYRRTSTTYNSYIPECYDYTVALVHYQKSTHNGKVVDIFYDRLRTIDRGDLARAEQSSFSLCNGTEGGKAFAHPSYIIQKADRAGTLNNGSYEASFNGIEPTGRNKYFTNNGSTSYGIDHYLVGGKDDNGALNNTFIAAYGITGSGASWSKCILPIGNTYDGSPCGIQWPWSAITAYYTPPVSPANTGKLTIRVQASSGVSMNTYTVPLLVLRK